MYYKKIDEHKKEIDNDSNKEHGIQKKKFCLQWIIVVKFK